VGEAGAGFSPGFDKHLLIRIGPNTAKKYVDVYAVVYCNVGDHVVKDEASETVRNRLARRLARNFWKS
jgi:hypothetical protein